MIKRALAFLAAVGLLVTLIGSPAQAVTSYYHVAGTQNVNNTGVFATLGVYNPTVSGTGAGHSLAEIVVKNAAGDTIELGWIKAAGDTNPSLFAAHWEAGVFQGYNNADFVDVAGGVNLGDSLSGAVGTNKNFQIYHSSTQAFWFVAYNGVNIASIADNKFSPSFTTATNIQAYGEVAHATDSTPCTQMGNGTLAAAPATGGVISSVSYVSTTFVTTNASLTQSTNASGTYNLNTVTARTFTYGGPGWCP